MHVLGRGPRASGASVGIVGEQSEQQGGAGERSEPRGGVGRAKRAAWGVGGGRSEGWGGPPAGLA